MGSIISKSFRELFRNWRVFLPLYIILVVVWLLLAETDTVAAAIINTLVGLAAWMVVSFLLSRSLDGKKVSLREGLYTGFTPTVPLVLLRLLEGLQCLPILIVLVAASSAVETNAFSNSALAVGFLIFACLMLAITWCLIPATVMAMAVATEPGMYPGAALKRAREMMKGKTAQWWGRSLVMILIVGAIAGAIYLPVASATIDMVGANWYLKTAESLALGFIWIFEAAFYYIYYREIVSKADMKLEKNKTKRRKNEKK